MTVLCIAKLVKTRERCCTQNCNAKKVVAVIAGFIAKKFIEKLQFAGCRQLLIVSSFQPLFQEYDCLLKLSRCDLMIHSVELTACAGNEMFCIVEF